MATSKKAQQAAKAQVVRQGIKAIAEGRATSSQVLAALEPDGSPDPADIEAQAQAAAMDQPDLDTPPTGQAAAKEATAIIAKATKAAKATAKPAAKPDVKLAAGEKRCPGVPGLAKPHAAAANTDTFTAKAVMPDKLSRRCKACQKLDRDRRKAANAKAAKPAAKAKATTKATKTTKRAPTAAQRRRALRKAELAGEAAANA